MKQPNKKVIYGIGVVLLISMLSDIITFLSNSELHVFETNPLYLLTNSWSWIVIIKIAINVSLIYMILNLKADTTRFLFVTMLTYLTILQFYGAYANMQVSHLVSQGADIVPLEKNHAIISYSIIVLLVGYLPMFVTFLCFVLWKWCYKEEQNGDK